MNHFSFTIPGKPVAWQRAGMNGAGKGPAVLYTKSPSRAYQSLIREAAQKVWLTGPSDAGFLLGVYLYVKRPKSHFNKKGLKADAPVKCMRRPDLDNLSKQVGDALNGVVWHDDAQVVDLNARRIWGDTDFLSVNMVVIQ